MPILCVTHHLTVKLKKKDFSCIFGINKHLPGHLFELVTDHKPLLTLFHQYKPTSSQASAHIRQWSLLLATILYSMAPNYHKGD